MYDEFVIRQVDTNRHTGVRALDFNVRTGPHPRGSYLLRKRKQGKY